MQTAITNSSQNSYSYLPSYNAIRQTIQRVHHLDLPTELLTLDSFVIPNYMKQTLKGSDFLISNTTVNQSRILMFTTADNFCHLNHSPYWIMDGTFKTVPNIFKQLYTIHDCIGGNENSRIMPLVFSLMTEKSMESYRRLFQGLIDFAEEHNIDLSPQIVLTDFEVAIINAVQSEFDNVRNKGYHFHFIQSVYHRIQTSELATHYGTDEDFSILMRHISALAFLPHSKIPAVFDELKNHIPVEAHDIIQWFKDNYVYSRVRRMHRNSILIQSEPFFSLIFGLYLKILSLLT
ncbi:hypothetical protein F8M41_026445 [Gigaspora margarita]|uniref:MULE transposase domain-containing protein n=1 Tax=Gigaspora margarita TaxID=4874 RepID=A0A8H4A904_GIGMA|nr:hypothetical protein F8M41_026445 [Gigaspora margarita]